MNKKQKVEKAINLLLEELKGLDYATAKYVVQTIELHLIRNSTVNTDISDIDKVKLLDENFDYFENTFKNSETSPLKDRISNPSLDNEIKTEKVLLLLKQLGTELGMFPI